MPFMCLFSADHGHSHGHDHGHSHGHHGGGGGGGGSLVVMKAFYGAFNGKDCEPS